jgi:hypothetical protein
VELGLAPGNEAAVQPDLAVARIEWNQTHRRLLAALLNSAPQGPLPRYYEDKLTKPDS